MNSPQPTLPTTGAGIVEIQAPMGDAAAHRNAELDPARPLLLILGIGLVLRLLHLFFHTSTPYFGAPYLDELYSHQWATDIAAGRWSLDHAFFRAPLYYYGLGILYAIAGPNEFLVLALQHIGGLAGVALNFHVARKLSGGNAIAGLAAATLSALYAPALFFEGQRLDIWLQMIAAPGLLLLALRSMEQRDATHGWKAWGLFGLASGFAAIARPQTLPFSLLIVALGVSLPLRTAAPRLARVALPALLALAVPIAPVALHNWRAEKEFVPIATYAGVNLWIGNNATADGTTAKTPVRYPFFARYEDSVELFAVRRAAELLGRPVTSAQADRFWRAEALREMAANPGRTVAGLRRKLALFIQHYEYKNNKHIYAYAEYNPLQRALLPVVGYGTVMPLAVLGAMVLLFGSLTAPAGRQPDRPAALLYLLLLAVLALGVIAFFVNIRYRFPFAWMTIPAAGIGLVELLGLYHAKRWDSFWRAAAIVVCVGLVMRVDFFKVRPPDTKAEDLLEVANCWKDRGEWDNAISAYEKAIAADSASTDAWNNLGEVRFRKGDLVGAAAAFEKAVAVSGIDRPARYRALNNLGVVAEESGNLVRAGEIYRAITTEAPEQARAWINLGDVLRKQQQWESARDAYRKGVALDSTLALGHLGIAVCARRLGDEAAFSAAARDLQALGGERGMELLRKELGP